MLFPISAVPSRGSLYQACFRIGCAIVMANGCCGRGFMRFGMVDDGDCMIGILGLSFFVEG